MKTKLVLVVLLVLAGAYALATPYLTVEAMREAAREHDVAALSTHIDFPSVRQSFRDQFKALIDDKLADANGSVLARIGAGLASTVVDAAIEFMVTPEGVRQLMRGAKPYERDADTTDAGASRAREEQPFDDASYHYESLNRFVATVETDDGDEIDFVLHRHGLSWKLAEIRLPLKDEE